MSNKLKITVDDDGVMPKIKGALPLPPMGDIQTKIVEMSADFVAGGINATLSAIYGMINRLPAPPEGHEVSEICFKLLIDARGEVSLLSAVKGSVAGQSAIEFKITRKS